MTEGIGERNGGGLPGHHEGARQVSPWAKASTLSPNSSRHGTPESQIGKGLGGHVTCPLSPARVGTIRKLKGPLSTPMPPVS